MRSSHATSRALPYAGLAIYVVAEALIFVPLASGVAMALIDRSLVFGFSLGIVFSIGMVLLAARAAVL